ncbi:hypothetical protein AWB67_05728 [Caballeronia terrestris]|uniref:Uncharacterized protein n=1 Tax=Caballeronia terrestris TaxID=1226301 RepID=A0A158KK82_9BURK|nr:hypothetical protein [Caballeronia terrestris]SAL80970.1 hypothetical protein AWB67_05728 [Caballeronia terrestris]
MQAEIRASVKQSAAEADEHGRSHPDANFAEVDAPFNQYASAQERNAKVGRLQRLPENVRQRNAGVTFMQRIQNSCPRIKRAWLATAYQPPMDAIDGVGKMDFKETIAMIETDNGWQAARNPAVGSTDPLFLPNI